MKNKILLIISTLLITFQAYTFTGYDVDLKIIAKIESNNNSGAFNFKSKARGLYQIRPICLADYNLYHKHKYELSQLFNPIINKKIAIWYFQKRIPQLLKHYKVPINLVTVLGSYNFGSRHIKHWYFRTGDINRLPYITQRYIKKYKLLRLKKLGK